jgi:VanZ family protein
LLVVIALAAVLAYLSLRASHHLHNISWMPARLGYWADRNGVLRNTVAFFGFALIVFSLVGRGRWPVVGLGAFAIAIEVAQIWIPTRIFDWKDIVAGLAGIVLAWAAVWGAQRLWRIRAVAHGKTS